MRVTIDGVDYVSVTGDRITLNGIVYARLEHQRNAESSFTRIEDGDGDTWHKMPGEDRWAINGVYRFDRDVEPREHIESLYGIAREY